ncbi:MAG: NADH-quinone oxidoreductase subunit NuoH, partial [Acidobacteria bacterium]|nr:NADH-quinone oxidoreductase subunit NuoH [Acidobacteriota bacterium]
VKVAIALGFMLGLALPVIYAELKIMAHMQNRVGPYYAGGRWGWAQPIADGLKFVQKEDLVPADADAPVFKTAPYVVIMATIAIFVVIPLGPDLVARDLDLGAFYLLAISSIGTLGVLMAGWSSANKYSLMGGLRAAAQLIAYELPLLLAVLAVVVQAGTMSLTGIVEAQSAAITIGPISVSLPFILTGQIISFVIFVIAMVAELSRIPFDMPIAESELTMGYLTEYSSVRFSMFFLAEYASLIALSMVVATLFLGGYFVPLVPEAWLNLVGPMVVLGKAALIVFFVLWIRSTFPRLREDQLQNLAWRWLIPISLVNILVISFFAVAI